MADLIELQAHLDAWGLRARGALREGGRVIALVGNAGPAFWAAFQDQPEGHDGQPDPLDRFTRRALIEVAEALGAEARFPFEPPYPPIQRMATQGSGARPSPLGLLVDPEFGLWHAYRGILSWDEGDPRAPLVEPEPPRPHPCEGCARPCLEACPVGAFQPEGYDVDRCRAYLSAEARACVKVGCLCRHACPIGQGYAYEMAQARHHMRAFMAW